MPPSLTRFPVRVLIALVGVIAPLCLGCPNANTYGTPRTVSKGEIQHSIAVEGIGVRLPESSGSSGIFLPTLPTYTFRVGVHERVDIGARVSNLTSLGADVKLNIVKGVFDMAVDPGFQGFYLPGTGIFYFHMPLLLGINPTDWFSITLTPGVVGAVATSTTTSSSDRDSTFSAGGVLGRLGMGFEFRIAKTFSLFPEVTAMGNFGNGGIIFNAGIGINFGKLPSYDDLRDPPTLVQDQPPAGTPQAPALR